MNIPKLFKECMLKYLNNDINDELINKQLLSIEKLTCGKKYIYDYVENLTDYFESKKVTIENKNNVANYLIRIIPRNNTDNDQSWQENQRKLFDIYKKFTNRNYDSCEIETNNNKYKKLWVESNKYISNIIKDIIEKYNNVNELVNTLNINKSTLFEYLRFLINLNHEGKIIPNQYEEFCNSDILSNEDIQSDEAEKLKDVVSYLGYDIRKYLVHPSIGKLHMIKSISLEKINKKIDALFEKNYNDPKKYSNSNYKKATKFLIVDYFERMRKGTLDESRRSVFSKIYLKNVHDKLKKLENPKEVDYKRWIWELIQNAKNNSNGKDVDIQIVVNNDEYIFKHNGAPFNVETFTSLIYKFDENKENPMESNDHFSTGFLSTHCLSKNVKLSSQITTNNNSEPQGFTITMYREGKDENLLEGLQKTENSFKYPIESDEWTTYEYTTTTDKNRKAGKLGIENFKSNIYKTMLFCPEIRSINLNDNGKILSIERKDVIENFDDKCHKLILSIRDGERDFKKSFLYTIINEHNDKYGDKNNLRICCAIELDNDDNVSVDSSSLCFFCSLPVVGYEKHELPFIINSPDFVPDSKKQSILLDENCEINKTILLKSKKMFEVLLKCLCKNNVGKRYLLIRGMDTIPNENENFDLAWYKENFEKPMRNTIIQFPIIYNENNKQFTKLTDINIPIIDYNNSEDLQKAYSFISQIYKHNVPTFDETIFLNEIFGKMMKN